MGDGLHFDRVAEAYGRGRPDYPPEVYALLARHGLLAPGRHLLELGAGSGQATAELLRRGATVEAVEPGPALAAALRARFPQVTVREKRAEDADLADAAYDGVVAATSLHWVDVPAVLPRLHRALRPGGLLVPWWTVFGDPEWHSDFRARVDEIAGQGLAGETPRPLRIEERVAELEDGGLFELVEHRIHPWEHTMTPEQVGDLFTTFPTWSPDAVAAVVAAARDCGPTVTERYLTVVYVARRVD